MVKRLRSESSDVEIERLSMIEHSGRKEERKTPLQSAWRMHLVDPSWDCCRGLGIVISVAAAVEGGQAVHE